MTIPSVPAVSIVIVTYNRRRAFARTLQSVQAQVYPHREIIVVDNHSRDRYAEFVARRAPEARVIELDENRGAAGGRNAGIREAKGDIIITLDDDIFFEGPLEISKTVEVFATRPNVHVLAYQVCEAETGAPRLREWCHPRDWVEYAETEFETHFFVEGACAARRQVYEMVGLYYEPLFLYCEGWDLGLRILDRGFRILHIPSIRVRHLMASEGRASSRPYRLFPRNYIWIAFKDYTAPRGIAWLAARLLMMLYFSVRAGHVLAFCRGVGDGFAGLPRVWRDRAPIQSATLRYLRGLESHRPNLVTRLRRHREAVQI